MFKSRERERVHGRVPLKRAAAEEKPVSSLPLELGRMSRRAAMDSRSREVKVVLLGDTGEPCLSSVEVLLEIGLLSCVRRLPPREVSYVKCVSQAWLMADRNSFCLSCSSCTLTLLLQQGVELLLCVACWKKLASCTAKVCAWNALLAV